MTGGGFTLCSLLVIAWPLPCFVVQAGVAAPRPLLALLSWLGCCPVVVAGVVALVSVVAAGMVG